MLGGGYNSENWAGVALPLVRRIFGDISAKEYLSVQPMNLPSGLVFYLDFKYGSDRSPFANGSSVMSADPNTNVTDLSQGLYGAGRFGYSINNATASGVASTGSVAFSDVNFDGNYIATGSYRKVTVTGLGAASSSFDTNAVRAFTFTSGSVVGTANILQQFTSINGAGTQITFITTGSFVPGIVTLNYVKATNPAQLVIS